MQEPDFAVRLVLISAERLHRMANAQAHREALLAEMNSLQKRVGDAIYQMEKNLEWQPSEGILPDA